ncbi:MAG: HDOD domain-containing protein [Lachnospiraceae bacterium]|nr:HDOD domain-containing protein [Lachnospiraceae bacterium]
MLAALMPLFNENMTVKAYSVFSEKENPFLNPDMAVGARYDGVGRVSGLEVVSSMGSAVLSDEKSVFVPIDHIAIFADLADQCKVPKNKVVLLMDPSITPDDDYIKRIKFLRGQGFRFAIRKLNVDRFEAYRPILSECEYVLLDHKKIVISKAKIYFSKLYPDIKLVAVNVNSQDEYNELSSDGKYDLYEGEFFRVPVTSNEKEVNPLKINYIELLNVVNAPDFDLTDAADVIGRDAGLVISLLEIVNHIAINSEITSVRHAAAMLGQKELKRWINTAVTKELCADKPSEITRMSMVRAKFAENLAPVFNIGGFSSELFLTGLFSCIDIMLDKPMDEALKMLHVAKNINDALISGKGDLAPVIDFVRLYENAEFIEVCRRMIVDDIDMDTVYEAYLNALSWYRDLFMNMK